jgi:uncharacterized protein (TIGR04255 family)
MTRSASIKGVSDRVDAAVVHFERPPVSEVVVGLEFDPIPSIGVMGLAALHSLWSEDFPASQEVDALPPSRPASQGPGIGVFFGQTPGVRLWSVSADGHTLVQVQRDRLVFNWRRLDADRGTYPGVDEVIRIYSDVVEKFRSYVEGQLHSELRPLVAEWSYINQIEAAGDLGKEVFQVWRDPDESLVGDVVQSMFQHVRAWEQPDGGASGQLEILGQPLGLGPNATLQLTITCKYFMSGTTDLSQALTYCREAHDRARSAFETITTPEAQEVWRGTNP